MSIFMSIVRSGSTVPLKRRVKLAFGHGQSRSSANGALKYSCILIPVTQWEAAPIKSVLRNIPSLESHCVDEWLSLRVKIR